LIMNITNARNKQDLQALINQFLASSPEEREELKPSIFSLGNEVVVLITKAIAEEPSTRSRDIAREVVLEIGPPAVDPLLILLRDNNEIVRELAIDLLGELKDPKSIVPLINCLGDWSKGVRQAIADVLLILSQFGDITDKIIQFILEAPPTVILDVDKISNLLVNIGQAHATSEHLLKLAARAKIEGNEVGLRRILRIAEGSARKEGIVDTLHLMIGRGELDIESARELWLEVGDFSVPKERKDILEQAFKNVRNVVERGLENWETMSFQANTAFSTTLWMGKVIFIGGLFLVASSLIATYYLIISRAEGIAVWIGSSVTGLAGLGSVLLTFYKNPTNQIKQATSTLAQINVIFIGFMNRVGQISATFENQFMAGKVGIRELKETTNLIREAIQDSQESIGNLSRKTADNGES